MHFGLSSPTSPVIISSSLPLSTYVYRALLTQGARPSLLEQLPLLVLPSSLPRRAYDPWLFLLLLFDSAGLRSAPFPSTDTVQPPACVVGDPFVETGVLLSPGSGKCEIRHRAPHTGQRLAVRWSCKVLQPGASPGRAHAAGLQPTGVIKRVFPSPEDPPNTPSTPDVLQTLLQSYYLRSIFEDK